MYDRILVPTDGSPGSETVATHAAELAAATGATLDAIYVVDESALDIEMEGGKEVEAARRAAGEAALAEFTETVEAHDVEFSTELRRGIPHRAIASYADEVDADLVVMGTHGRQGLERYVLGSVTEHVLRAAEQPVLAVKLTAVAVPDAEEAEQVARETLSEENDGLAELREEPYRERSTWVVPALTESGRRVNVHVDVDSGDVRVAHLD